VVVSQVAPYSSFVVSAPILTPAKAAVQTAKTTALSAPKAYSVELSDSAQVRSLKLQGFSVSMIAIKLGLDKTTINQYLGITESAVTTKSTYVPPKQTYTEPKALSEGRTLLFQDVNQLTMAQFTWSSMQSKLLQTANSLLEG
jgi:hypothetical protein